MKRFRLSGILAILAAMLTSPQGWADNAPSAKTNLPPGASLSGRHWEESAAWGLTNPVNRQAHQTTTPVTILGGDDAESKAIAEPKAPAEPNKAVEPKKPVNDAAVCPTTPPSLLDCCQPCGAPGRFWIDGEYSLWWMRGAKSPPLATASPAGTPVFLGGVPGSPGTSTVIGDESLNNGLQYGFHIRAGAWLDSCRKWGIEGGFQWIGGNDDNAVAGSPDGSNIVGRPFIDAATGLPAAQLVSFPGVLAGTVSVDAEVSQFWGWDLLTRRQLCCTADCSNDPCARFTNYRRWDLLFGYRHYDFSDEITLTENLFPQDPTFVPGTQIILTDQFRARNRFDGVVLGIAGERTYNRLYMQGAIKLNVGQTTRDVSIYGQTIVNVPGDVTTVNSGGLLALRSNIGTYRDTDWNVLPELQLRLGVRFTSCVTGFVGYNLLIWPDVARAAEQIDPVINQQLIPPPLDPITGPNRPAFLGNTSTLWMHGVTAGINWRF